MLSAYAKAAVKLVGFVGGGDALPEDELTHAGIEVDRERLTAYQKVCGFGVGDTLPATHPHMFAFPLAMELMTRLSFPFGVIGLVHISNDIEQLRPITADEVLDIRVRTADLRDHERGRQFDVVASAEVAGETVWRSESTYLRREGGGEAKGGRSEPPEASAIWRIPGDQGRRYAGVSGDNNPIHLYPLTARLFGFPKPIAHGMWVKARCLAALDGHLPDAFTVSVRFKLPVLLPSKAGFATWTSGEQREFAVHDTRSGKPHVSGTVT
ncbi:MAG: MaoC/PaaZ C-terminal domain-containing protein [Solirubrobacteraceae bacterium]